MPFEGGAAGGRAEPPLEVESPVNELAFPQPEVPPEKVSVSPPPENVLASPQTEELPDNVHASSWTEVSPENVLASPRTELSPENVPSDCGVLVAILPEELLENVFAAKWPGGEFWT